MDWPPKDPEALKLWLLDEMPVLRERREVLIDRIAKGQAVLHQPVTARLSRINVARTETSDPTFDVVALWSVELPALTREVESIDALLGEYTMAKAALDERPRKVIELHYEYYLGPAEVCKALAISARTYDRDHSGALRIMTAVLEWKHTG